MVDNLYSLPGLECGNGLLPLVLWNGLIELNLESLGTWNSSIIEFKEISHAFKQMSWKGTSGCLVPEATFGNRSETK